MLFRSKVMHVPAQENTPGRSTVKCLASRCIGPFRGKGHEIIMIRIVADDKIPFLKGVLEPFADIRYVPGSKISRDMLINTDALLIRTRTKCTPSLLEGTSVKFIATATIGFDHIDVKYCEDQNISWTNAPGCNSSSVQQYVAAALLKISGNYGFSLKEKTIGIVGVGNVGSKIERFAGIM